MIIQAVRSHDHTNVQLFPAQQEGPEMDESRSMKSCVDPGYI